MELKDYVSKYYDAAAAVSSDKLPAAFILAHSYFESGKGTSQLTKKANNFFGVKARPGEPFITMQTRELRNGKYLYMPQNFRKYDNARQSFEAYSNLLKIPRYKRVLDAKSFLDKAQLLKVTGYYGAENSAINNLANIATEAQKLINNLPGSGTALKIIPFLLVSGALVYFVIKNK